MSDEFMKIISIEADKRNVDEIYVTVHHKNENHQKFTSFIQKHGFTFHGFKNNEHVYLKNLKEIEIK
jgi:hypothetical protein